jgi:hypothetical protein
LDLNLAAFSLGTLRIKPHTMYEIYVQYVDRWKVETSIEVRETVNPLVIRSEETSEGENNSDKEEEVADKRKKRKRCRIIVCSPLNIPQVQRFNKKEVSLEQA